MKQFFFYLGLSCVIISCQNINDKGTTTQVPDCKPPIEVLDRFHRNAYFPDDPSIDCIILENVKTHLSGVLKDYSSYEPVSFAEFIGSRPAKADSLWVVLQESGFPSDSVKMAKSILNLDSLYEVFRGYEYVGYSVKHKLRAKNSYGALEIETYKFNLDKKLEVISMEDSQYIEDYFN